MDPAEPFVIFPRFDESMKSPDKRLYSFIYKHFFIRLASNLTFAYFAFFRYPLG